MCGLIAWIGEMPVDVLEMSTLSGGRGPHQHGFVYHSGAFERVVAMGPLDISKHKSSGLTSSKFVVGHSRLATSGSHPGELPDVDEAQPYLRDGLVVAHNGVINLEANKESGFGVDTEMLFDVHDWNADGESLLLDPHKFLAFHHEEYKHNHALITAVDGGLAASSFGQPLFYRRDENGIAISSVKTNTGEWFRILGTTLFGRDGEIV